MPPRRVSMPTATNVKRKQRDDSVLQHPNHLLAGYLAHEAADVEPDNRQRYADVASLLKTDGAHIQGIVNPSQLGRLLQM
ncbi:hypothetical protein GQ457_04G027030 [Hibiscus cannabinus]